MRMFWRWASAVIGSPRFSRALPPSATTMRMAPSFAPPQAIVATRMALMVCIRFSA